MTGPISTNDKLNLETATISWKELELFFAKGKLLVIEETMDLVKVASIIASNDTEALSELIEKHDVAFPSTDWVKKHCNPETKLWAVVVSPYVIAQLK